MDMSESNKNKYLLVNVFTGMAVVVLGMYYVKVIKMERIVANLIKYLFHYPFNIYWYLFQYFRRQFIPYQTLD